MEHIKEAFETIKGYCDKQPICGKGCMFYNSESGWCIITENTPCDWKIPEEISD